MSKLLMINEVAQNYNITKRTLRYYEEIGLLENIKKNNSNYRYYDEEALSRLEQILLLRGLDFHINEIKQILVSKDDEVIDSILRDKVLKLQGDIDNLLSLKKIISSIISIKNDIGMKQVNTYEILKEQIYIHKNIERVFEMSQFIQDIIIIEFGINIIECASVIIENVKELRKNIKNQLNEEIPLIRIRDNADLKDNEYKIIIKGITVKQELLQDVMESEKSNIIIEKLKDAILCNIQSIIE